MAKIPLSRERALDLVRDFMSIPGLAELDYLICGSIRRGKDEVGDIDLIVIGEFPDNGPSQKFYESGAKKSRTYMYKKAQINMWTCPVEAVGSFILYATGSGSFNKALRTRAINKNMKLSQHGLFNRKNGELIARETEKEIFNHLDLKYIPPKDRQIKTTTFRSLTKAFSLRTKPDRSHVSRLLGRVDNPTAFPPDIQKFLPYTGNFILPSLILATPEDWLGQLRKK